VAVKSGQFTADEMGKGQFLRGNRRNLAGEGVVRKILSPTRVAIVLIFAMVVAKRAETWVTGSVAPVLANESAHPFPGSLA